MIKVFIIATMSADGYIAQNSSHSPMYWSSKADKKRFVELTKRAGVVVMGSSTYKTIGRPLKERLNIVYSRTEVFEGVEMTQDEPKDLIKKLEERGVKEVAICGGTHIYSMFMKAGVVDTLYLSIEPLLFGKGLSLFNDDFHFPLILKSSQVSESSNTLFLEYEVDRSQTPKINVE